MIEPELAFADLNDDMACASSYLQYVVGALFCLVLNSVSDYFIQTIFYGCFTVTDLLNCGEDVSICLHHLPSYCLFDTGEVCSRELQRRYGFL